MFIMILAFFSPTEDKIFIQELPDFEQNDTRIMVLEHQHKEALDHGLRVDILAPTPTHLRVMALEKIYKD
jgi:uroporphyrinogen-III synthase